MKTSPRSPPDDTQQVPDLGGQEAEHVPYEPPGRGRTPATTNAISRIASTMTAKPPAI